VLAWLCFRVECTQSAVMLPWYAKNDWNRIWHYTLQLGQQQIAVGAAIYRLQEAIVVGYICGMYLRHLVFAVVAGAPGQGQQRPRSLVWHSRRS